MSHHESSKEYGSESEEEREELDKVSVHEDEGEDGELASETDPDKATGSTSVNSKNLDSIKLPQTRV